MKIIPFVRFSSFILLFNSVAGPAAPKVDLLQGSSSTREAYIRQASVWAPSDVGSYDFRTGRPVKKGFAWNEEVSCTFVEPEKLPSGLSPKFQCAVGEENFKVKFFVPAGESLAEVASARLLSALGYAADHMFPVIVQCENCPANPFLYTLNKFGFRGTLPIPLGRLPLPENRGAHTFPEAAIERKLDGVTIELNDGQGWTWAEFDTLLSLDPEVAGRQRTERDSLKLLMAFLQNTDTKQDNQRLICPADAVVLTSATTATCAAPVLYPHDVGFTFGNGAQGSPFSKANWFDWKSAPVWSDARTCTANLKPRVGGDLSNPVISEAGRQFLVARLRQLSRSQIESLFEAARFELKQDGLLNLFVGFKHVSAADWADTFADKVSQIENARCPN